MKVLWLVIIKILKFLLKVKKKQMLKKIMLVINNKIKLIWILKIFFLKILVNLN